MVIKLSITYDSDNTNPTDTLDIEFNDGANSDVYFSLSNSDREVSVDKDELKKILSML